MKQSIITTKRFEAAYYTNFDCSVALNRFLMDNGSQKVIPEFKIEGENVVRIKKQYDEVESLLDPDLYIKEQDYINGLVKKEFFLYLNALAEEEKKKKQARGGEI